MEKKQFSWKNILIPTAIASAIASYPFIKEYVQNIVSPKSDVSRISCIEKIASQLDSDTLNICAVDGLNISINDVGKKVLLDKILNYQKTRSIEDFLIFHKKNKIYGALHSTDAYLVQEMYNPLGDDDYLVTSPFGERKMRVKGKGRKRWKTWMENHLGLDMVQFPKIIRGKKYSNKRHEIYSGVNGKIVELNEDRKNPSGRYVMIESNGVKYKYNHLSKIDEELAVGEKVYARQAIGLMGNTGRSYGSHLDLKVYTGWDGFKHYIDPEPLITKNLKDRKSQKNMEKMMFLLRFH